MRMGFLWAFAALAGAAGAAAPPGGAAAPVRAGAEARLAQAPLSFEQNVGQFDRRARFVVRAGGAAVFITDSGAVMRLPGRPLGDRSGPAPARTGPGAVVRMALTGARRPASVRGEGRLPGTANYFLGNDPRKWRTGVATWRGVRCAGVYPGTDIVYYGNPQRLEYDFVLAPGADPRRIGLALEGAEGLRVAANGDLIAATAAGEIALKRPYAYQQAGGRRVPVACDYRLAPGTRRVGFRLARYDASRPLIVDPAVVYSTYLGGSNGDTAYGIASGSDGSAYIAGQTNSTDFPTSVGALRGVLTGGYDAFVTHINAAGTALLYSTFFGGTLNDYASSIAVDSTGAASITGYTASLNLPTSATAYLRTRSGGNDAFAAKLNSAGTALTFSTYLGGLSGNTTGFGIATDSSGAVYVGGATTSGFYPTTAGAYQTVLAGAQDGFLTKVSANGSSLVYSTLLGTTLSQTITAIAVDSAGDCYVGGYTTSAGFPVTPGARQQTSGGSQDGFVTRFNASGSSLVYSTFLGGTATDAVNGLAIDSSGCAYAVGATSSSTSFPTTLDSFQTTYGGGLMDGFVTKLSADGSSLAYSTFLGGAGADYGRAIAVTPSGLACVVGQTASADFPVTPDAWQATYGGNTDAFVSRLSATGALMVYSTYLGGTTVDYGYAAAADSYGTIYVAGVTNSMDLPVVTGSYQTALKGTQQDAFAARITFADPSSLVGSDATGRPGETVSLTATLTSGGIAVAGRSIAFTVAGAPVGSATTDAAGLATRNYTLPAGPGGASAAIHAAWAGDGSYAASSATTTLTIGAAATVIAVPSPSAELGSTVALTATLTSNGLPVEARDIDFSVDGALAGTGTTDAAGVATLLFYVSPDALLGGHIVTADYAGATDYLAGTGEGVLTVTPHPTALAVGGLNAPIGRTVQLSATLTTGGVGLDGRFVTLTLDGVALGTLVTDASGVVSLAWTVPGSATTGAHTLAASFAGDSNYGDSAGSGTVTVLPRPAASRIYVAPKTQSMGNYVLLSAELTDTASTPAKVAGKTIRFTLDGSALGTAVTQGSPTTGMATLRLNITEALALGSHSIGASFDGDDAYDPSSGTGTLTVTRGVTRITAADMSAVIGATVTLKGVLTRTDGYLAGRTLSFTVDGSIVGTGTTNASGAATCSYAVGSVGAVRSVVIGFAGDTLDLPASATNTLTVGYKPTRVYVSPRTGAMGERVLLSATLFDSATGLKLEGKSLAFTVAGVPVGSAVVSGGLAVLPWTVTEAGGAGSRSILASFAGDLEYASSSGSAALTVTKATTYVTSADLAAVKGSSVTLRGTLSRLGGYVAGATLTFKVDGASVGTGTTGATGVATLGYTVSDSVGSHTLAVEFAGDAVNLASSATKTLTVSAPASRIYVPSLSRAYYDTALIGGQLLDAATGAKLSGKTLEMLIDGASIGTAVTVGGQATVSYTVPTSLSVGDHTITVSFGGDGSYAASTQTGTLTVGLATARLTVSSPTVAAGGTVTLTGVLTRIGGYAPGRTLTFKVDGSAVGSATTNASGRGTLAYTASLAAGSHTITVEFAGDSILKPVTSSGTLTVTP